MHLSFVIAWPNECAKTNIKKRYYRNIDLRYDVSLNEFLIFHYQLGILTLIMSVLLSLLLPVTELAFVICLCSTLISGYFVVILYDNNAVDGVNALKRAQIFKPPTSLSPVNED